MRIRILQVLDSGVDGYPFMPGQVVTVTNPPPWMLGYLDGEKAIRLPDEDEIATEPAPETAAESVVEVAVAPESSEQAVTHKGKRERRRRH